MFPNLTTNRLTAPIEAPQPWQPGDPIHPPGAGGSGAQYRTYLFNFRYDDDSEQCHCSDAAHWPGPRDHYLGDRDELGELITVTRHDAIHAMVRAALLARIPWLHVPSWPAT